MANWLQDIGTFFRSDVEYDYRVASPQMNVRQAAGSQMIKWETGQPQWMEKNVREFDHRGHRQVSMIFACVQYIADAAATAPIVIERDLQNGQVEEVPDHPMRTLLNRPNIGQGMGAFISFVTMMATITGFAVIEKERDSYGNVIGLWVLRSDWLRPIPRSAGVYDWQYTVPGHERPFIIDADDTIPLTYADVMTGSPVGISPIEVVFQEAQILNDLDDFLKAFLERGAMPMYFALPETDGAVAAQWAKPETVDAFRTKFRDTYGGLGNAMDILISPAIKDIKPLGFSINELAYTDLRDVSEASIATAFGIPPILLNTRYGLQHATYSNYEQARRAFYEDKMVPWWARLDDALSRHLMPEFETDSSYNLVFDTSDIPALRDDVGAAHDRAVAAWQSGMISREVAQREAGYDPHGADVFLVPFSSIQIPVSGVVDDAPVDDAVRRVITDELLPALASQIHDERYAKEPKFITRDGRTYANERADSPAQRAGLIQIAQKHRADMARLADRLEPEVETFLRAQGNRVIAAATDSRAANEPWEHRAIEAYEWFMDDDELRALMREWWALVTETAFGTTATELGVTWSFSGANPYLAEIENILGYRIRGINETTRKMVETIVREKLQEGTTIPDLKAALEDMLEPTYRNRATVVARTESQVALNTATQKAYTASGQVTNVRLMDGTECDAPAGSDGLTCPQRNGLVVPLANVSRHVFAEHPQGTLSYAAILDPIEGV